MEIAGRTALMLIRLPSPESTSFTSTTSYRVRLLNKMRIRMMISESRVKSWLIIDMASALFGCPADRVPASRQASDAWCVAAIGCLNLWAMEPANAPIVVTRFICAISRLHLAPISALSSARFQFRDGNVGPVEPREFSPANLGDRSDHPALFSTPAER